MVRIIFHSRCFSFWSFYPYYCDVFITVLFCVNAFWCLHSFVWRAKSKKALEPIQYKLKSRKVWPDLTHAHAHTHVCYLRVCYCFWFFFLVFWKTRWKTFSSLFYYTLSNIYFDLTTHTHIDTHIHTHADTHTHTHTHTYILTHTHSDRRGRRRLLW